MAQNITLLGASYSDVPSVLLPKTGGGTAQFDDTTDANATASDIASGKTAYVNGTKLTGTGGGGSSPQIKTGTVTFTTTYSSAGNRKIVDISTIGFTPKRFYFMIRDKATVSGISSVILRASFETDSSTSGGYIRTVTRYTNTSNSLGSTQNGSSWTTQSSYLLYCDGSSIYIRTASTYLISANTTYDWIAIA